MIEVSKVSKQEGVQFLSMSNAGKELGVSRTTMYYYVEQLSIEIKKFPLDRKSYIALADLQRIKDAKRAAEEGRR